MDTKPAQPDLLRDAPHEPTDFPPMPELLQRAMTLDKDCRVCISRAAPYHAISRWQGLTHIWTVFITSTRTSMGYHVNVEAPTFAGALEEAVAQAEARGWNVPPGRHPG